MASPPPVDENDVPGASLNGRSPEELKVPELKLWLTCRGAPTKGKKADLVERVKSYIKYGWDKKIKNPYGSVQTSSVSHSASNSAQQYDFPVHNWTSIVEAFRCSDHVPKFNNSNIVTYFVTRSVIDGLPSNDFKSINSSAENLFKCGHVQNIEVSRTDRVLYMQASCLPEMRKDRIYSLRLALNLNSYDISYASCGCPAGKGPSGSCKHIGAFCYAFCDFCKCGSIPDFLTCTEKLQSWNKPRGRKVDPIPVDKLCLRRFELTNKDHSSVVFDPRPQSLDKDENTSLYIEKLRCDLINSCSTQSCALLTILVPSMKYIEHDHTYALFSNDQLSSGNEAIKTNSLIVPLDDQILGDVNSELDFSPEIRVKMNAVLDSLNLTADQRLSLEAQTLKQNNSLWHQARRVRITGSKCGRILKQKKRTPALLQFCLYPRPFEKTPKAITWGRTKEPVARRAYVEQMKLCGHPNLTASLCGFYVHPDKGWLGASPDAKVSDPDDLSLGIAEFKCPFSKADVSIQTACEDKHFYCELTEDQGLKLNRDHHYYDQVQLQLYVSQASWCDFCVWTSKDMKIERIHPDTEWQQEQVPRLDTYFHDYILPEIVTPRVKPSYYL